MGSDATGWPPGVAPDPRKGCHGVTRGHAGRQGSDDDTLTPENGALSHRADFRRIFRQIPPMPLTAVRDASFGTFTPNCDRSQLASTRSFPQHLPEIQPQRVRDPQQGVQCGHAHTPLDKGDGLLGESGPPCHLVHGEAKALPPLAQEAGGLFANSGSCLVVQETTTMRKTGLKCLLTKVR